MCTFVALYKTGSSGSNVKRLLNFFNKFAKSKITRTFVAKFLRFI